MVQTRPFASKVEHMTEENDGRWAGRSMSNASAQSKLQSMYHQAEAA